MGDPSGCPYKTAMEEENGIVERTPYQPPQNPTAKGWT